MEVKTDAAKARKTARKTKIVRKFVDRLNESSAETVDSWKDDIATYKRVKAQKVSR